MATRGIIARKTETGLVGRYHHWDSYPEALGKTLHTLYNSHFNKDASAMMCVLIDAHPAGWSDINDADFSYVPGFASFTSSASVGENFNRDLYYKQLEQYEQTEQAKRPHCYCHGERREEAQTFTSLSDARNAWAEYAYIIDENAHAMAVHARTGEAWRELAVVDLDAEEPEWRYLGESDEEE
jgi:hypothetical protein